GWLGPRHSPQSVLRINPQIERARAGDAKVPSLGASHLLLTDVVEARTVSPKGIERSERRSVRRRVRDEGCAPAPFARGSADVGPPVALGYGDINIHA